MFVPDAFAPSEMYNLYATANRIIIIVAKNSLKPKTIGLSSQQISGMTWKPRATMRPVSPPLTTDGSQDNNLPNICRA